MRPLKENMTGQATSTTVMAPSSAAGQRRSPLVYVLIVLLLTLLLPPAVYLFMTGFFVKNPDGTFEAFTLEYPSWGTKWGTTARAFSKWSTMLRLMGTIG